VEAVIICVLTPLTKNREPDISFVIGTGQMIAPHRAKGTLVVLESTTYPGTTDEDWRYFLEEGWRMEAGVDFHLAFYQNVKIPLMKDDPGKEELSTSVRGVLLRGKTAPPYGRCQESG
jgi:UDP-N-acetyl-D-glucosamine dehydrogenase